MRVTKEQALDLHAAAVDWCERGFSEAYPKDRTTEYAHLIFAYTLARLGEEDACRELLETVPHESAPPSAPGLAEMFHHERGLDTVLMGPHVHYWLQLAYRVRTAQALRGDPISPDSLFLPFESPMSFLRDPPLYMLYRVRDRSHILEPYERPDAFKWLSSATTGEGVVLLDLSKKEDPRAFRDLFCQLAEASSADEATTEFRAGLLLLGLGRVHALRSTLVGKLLRQLPSTLETLFSIDNLDSVLLQLRLILCGLRAAAIFQASAPVGNLIEALRLLVRPISQQDNSGDVGLLACRCLSWIPRLGIGSDLESLVDGLGSLIPQEEHYLHWQYHLILAEYRFRIGMPDLAQSLLAQATPSLFGSRYAMMPRDRVRLANDYLRAIAHHPRVDRQVSCFLDFFERFSTEGDTFQSRPLCRLWNLELMEEVALGITHIDTWK